MEPKVTIVCITYNQEKFIKQALDSFVMQKTNFDFQVIISDDCSTDSTPNIIKEYEQKYPNIIKAFYQKENLGSFKNYKFALSQAKSKYLIVNEGDDYFIDENKLQKQVDFLEGHPDYSICFHPVKIIFEDNKIRTHIFPKQGEIKNGLTFDKLLNANLIQTNSAMYRWKQNALEEMPDDILPGDWYLHLIHAKDGKIYALNDVMSVYRRHSGGIWTDNDVTQKNLHRKHSLKEIKFYNSVYENLTNKSEKYLNEVYLPMFKQILDNSYNFGDIEKITEIKNLYPEVFERSINVQNPIHKKLKKYKKIYSKLIILSIILSIIILIQIVVQICSF